MKKKLLFITLLGIFGSCYGMEMETEQPVEQRAEVSSLEALPPEIKFYIVDILAQSQSLLEATKSIQALSMVNKDFYALINDRQTTEILIKKTLNPKVVYFTNEEYIVAGALATPGAVIWLNRQTIDPKRKKEIEHLFLSIIQKKDCMNEDEVLVPIVLKTFLKTNINVNLLHPIIQDTPLILAVNNGEYDFVKILLTHPKIDVNARANKQSDSVLHLAVLYANFANSNNMINALLGNEKIDTHIKNHKGLTPLDLAKKFLSKERFIELERIFQIHELDQILRQFESKNPITAKR